MAKRVNVSVIGSSPFALDPDGNLQAAVEEMKEHWQREISQVLPDKPDLIVLPEACDRPPNFNMEQRLAYYRVRGEQILEFFQEIARNNNCYLAYSAAREVEDGTWRNSTRLIDRKGEVTGTYNKNHLVIEETTEGGILCGKEAPIFETDFGRVACAICFDLNFEELRLKYVAAKPDLLLFSSMYHGGAVRTFWAYTCRTHLVGAIAGLQSYIISPVGDEIATTTNYFDFFTKTLNLDCKLIHLDHNWEKITQLKKKYGPGVIITDPGYLGAVLVTNEMEGVEVQDLLNEFGIEDLDSYFDRSLAHRHAPGNMEP